MDSSFYTDGGMTIGGESGHEVQASPGCNLIFCESGLIQALDTLTAKVAEGYKIGLFQNDFVPFLGMTLLNISPASFSGYGGLQLAYGWSAAVIDGVRAVSRAHPMTWVHDGGPVSCWVFGYYIVDEDGNLAWAERFCPAPHAVNSVGITVRVTPELTARNEFPKGDE